MSQAGVRFEVRTSEVDETLEPDLAADPYEAVKKLAERKASAVMQDLLNEGYAGQAAFIGADTMVVCDGEIFGKPADEADALRMLGRLQGRAHQVMTGVSVWLVDATNDDDFGIGYRSFVDTAQVIFHSQTEEQLRDYVACGESWDKAGAYAAQGEGARLIERIEGDKDTVIGFPVKRFMSEFSFLFE